MGAAPRVGRRCSSRRSGDLSLRRMPCDAVGIAGKTEDDARDTRQKGLLRCFWRASVKRRECGRGCRLRRVPQVCFYINGVLMHEPLHLYCNPNDKWVPFVCLANSQVSSPSGGPLVSCARRRPRAGTHVASSCSRPAGLCMQHRGCGVAIGKGTGTAGAAKGRLSSS